MSSEETTKKFLEFSFKNKCEHKSLLQDANADIGICVPGIKYRDHLIASFADMNRYNICISDTDWNFSETTRKFCDLCDGVSGSNSVICHNTGCSYFASISQTKQEEKEKCCEFCGAKNSSPQCCCHVD